MGAASIFNFSDNIVRNKCANCGSEDRVKVVQKTRKGGKRKITVQTRLCLKCRRKLS